MAIADRRLVKLENDRATFRYCATNTGQLTLCKLSVEEFIRRFIQYVLHEEFVKVGEESFDLYETISAGWRL